MKVLYVGSLDPGGTCAARFRALCGLESDVTGFDIDEYLQISGIPAWRRSLETHTLVGPSISRANTALRRVCADRRPDVIWVDKGTWVWPSTLRRLSKGGAFLVHHITDALDYPHWRVRLRRRLLRSTIDSYDVFFTTNVDDHARLSGRFASRIELTHLGYDHLRFEPTSLPAEVQGKWEDGAVFIGHYEPRTAAGILAIVRAGLPVKVYGHPGWFDSDCRDALGDRLRPSLGNEDYVHAIKGARIGLCFVSEYNYNQTASRSFEIPGCGTFLLAMRTPQHLECYEEGKEAEFFGSHEELVEKTGYYLEHHEERISIARRGHERCVSSGYSWDSLMKRDWSRVLDHYRERSRNRRAASG